MEWKNPLGETIFNRSYALKDESGNVIEDFEAACTRLAKFGAVNQEQEVKLEKLLKEQKIIPGGRWWSNAGKEYPQINNCFVLPTDEGVGKFCHDLCVTLMTGGGVGVNYSDIPHPVLRTDTKLPFYPELYISSKHPDYPFLIAQYPHMVRENPTENGAEIKVGYPVKDSREGWGVALLKTADGLLNCEEVVLNITDIRPRGTPIKSLGGVSAGPASLVLMIDGIFNAIMRSYLKKRTLGPIDWMRIANYIGRGVSAGGQRRSAQMAMLHWKHESVDKFVTCKDNDGDLEGMNISVVIDNTFVKQAGSKKTKAGKLFDRIIKHACTHGEPGLWNIELAKQTVPEAFATNPCGEQSLPKWGNCNLGHINLAAHSSPDEIVDSARVLTEMLINGTMKSKFPLPEFYRRVDKDRRIGVGILGFHTWLVKRGKKFDIDEDDEKFFMILQKIIREHANQYSKKIKIRKPETVTTVAPTGTISFIAGVTSGIEPMFCAAYKRKYYTGGVDQELAEQIIIDPLAKECLEKGIAVDDSFSLNTKQHLDVQIKIQKAFVDNSVSKTINLPTVGTFDIKQVRKDVLDALKRKIKGVTLYPNGARGNQPFTPVSLDEALKAEAKSEQIETKCSTGTCEL
jgi:ribonucleoside-triphosphate reductase